MMTDTIITMTAEAADHIRQGIVSEKGKHFRLAIKKTGCTGWMYKPEIVTEPKPDDIKVPLALDFEVYIDPKCVDIIRGTELDIEVKDMGLKQMVFNNPNAESICGCGESFNVKE